VVGQVAVGLHEDEGLLLVRREEVGHWAGVVRTIEKFTARRELP
jgi:hypothetical protein